MLLYLVHVQSAYRLTADLGMIVAPYTAKTICAYAYVRILRIVCVKLKNDVLRKETPATDSSAM